MPFRYSWVKISLDGRGTEPRDASRGYCVVLPADAGFPIEEDVMSVDLLSVSRNEHANMPGQAKTYTLKIELSSVHPFDISQLAPIIQAGDHVGQYALFIKTQHDLTGFWRLPHEIRQTILRYVTTRDYPIPIWENGYRHRGPRATMRELDTSNPYAAAKLKAHRLNETHTPGLLTAGKKLNIEAMEALYGGNLFSMKVSSLPIFLERVGNKACEFLHRLEIVVDKVSDCHLNSLSCLAKLPHLRELLLSFASVGGKYVQLFAAKLFFERTREWITRIGEARHDKFAAANITTATSETLQSQQSTLRNDRSRDEEMQLREAGCSSFRADLRKFIDEPSLTEPDELSVCFSTQRLPQKYSGPEWSRWRIIEDLRTRGVCLDDELGSDAVEVRAGV